MTKGPSGVLQDSPSWLLSSEGKGKKSLAPSPERIPVHDNSLQRTPQFLLWYPSAFDALCRRLPFPFCLPAPHGVATSEESGAHSRSLLGCSEAALQGALLPPSCSGSLFSMRAGRELAGLLLPSHSCGRCRLQCPLVRLSRCSRIMRGGRGRG